MSYSKTTIISSFLWKLIERSSVQIISFIVSVVLARILMPSDYGVVAIVLVFVNIANVIIEGGLSQALIQTKHASEKDFSTIFLVSIALSVVLYGLIFLFAPLLAEIYNNEQLTDVLRVLAITLPFFAVNSIQRSYLSRNMQFKKLFKSSIIAVLFSGATGIYLAKSGYGVWALVFCNLINIIMTVIIMLFTVDWKPKFIFSKESFVRLFDFGWKIFLSNLLISLFVNIRSLIIGWKYKPAMLAFFDRGKQFPTLIMDNINVSLQSVLFPALSSEQDNKENVKSMVRRSIKTSSLVIFPLMTGMIVVAKPLIIFLLTDKWLEAVPFLQIFCIAFIMMPMQIANMEAIKSLGHSDITLKLEIIKKVLECTILIVSLMINVYAIAAGTVIYNFICIFINLYPNKKLLNYGFVEQIKDITPNLLISTIMAICVYAIQYIQISNLAILMIQIILGISMYVLLCTIFKIESFYYILNIIKNRKKK